MERIKDYLFRKKWENKKKKFQEKEDYLSREIDYLKNIAIMNIDEPGTYNKVIEKSHEMLDNNDFEKKYRKITGSKYNVNEAKKSLQQLEALYKKALEDAEKNGPARAKKELRKYREKCEKLGEKPNKPHIEELVNIKKKEIISEYFENLKARVKVILFAEEFLK